mgnify:FL=1
MTLLRMMISLILPFFARCYNSPEMIRIYARDNYRLVPYFAKPYIMRNKLNHEEARELIQEGSVGLLYASRKYNESKGYAFSTYSSSWIKKYMGDYIKSRYHKALPLKDENRIVLQENENYDYLLSGLTREERDIIVKRYLYKQKVQDIAKEYGYSRNTITYKCKKIIKKIRRINL